jgi:RimJ/RimL family protein N-acetyltransferase
MAVEPAPPAPRVAALRLQHFDSCWAELVASWIRDEREAHWLAPKTPPPLDAERIRQWKLPGHEPLQLVRADDPTPIAYGELNVLNAAQRHYWLGHLIVDPAWRGRGVGSALTQLLLRRAFTRHAARQVGLVVFPENRRAIACYRAARMQEDGYEEHVLPAHEQRVRLLRMTTGRLT